MPDRTLLIEKLTNFRNFIKDSILLDMNISNDKIKQNITDGLQERGIDANNADVNKLMDMSDIIQYVIDLDIDKELNDERLKIIEIGVLRFVTPAFENDGINLLKKIILSSFLKLDENYRLLPDKLDKIMLYLEFLHDYFNE